MRLSGSQDEEIKCQGLGDHVLRKRRSVSQDKGIRFPSIVDQIPGPKLRRSLSLKATAFISAEERFPG
jgi:hypothetical protein